MRKFIGVICSFLVSVCLSGCNNTTYRADTINSSLDTSKKITLKFAGASENFLGLDTVITSFEKKYPNVTIEYEYLQDYQNLIGKRLASSNDFDLWSSVNIQPTSKYASLAEYAYNLYSDKNINLSDCNEGLVKNSDYVGKENTNYGIPLGSDIRGLYVNKTLLKKYNLEVPTNLEELMNCGKVFKDNNMVSFFGNPSIFGQQFIYPYVANIIANASNYDEVYKEVSEIHVGVEELFRAPFKVLYDVMANYYYNYKYVENNYPAYQTFNGEDASKIGNITNGFFNIAKGEGVNDYKRDDVGTLPFVIGSLIQDSHYAKTKSDYNSLIDYEFIMSPTSKDGGFVYMSPTDTISINKNSKNIDWCVEFYNYLFTKSVNKKFASEYGCLPNISDNEDVINKFNVTENHISDVGKVTFNYGFYKIIADTALTMCKGNNPSYMDKTDPNNPVLYSFDYYMNILKGKFDAARSALNG